MKAIFLGLLLLAMSVFPCGTERWPVKVGTDPGAKQIKMTPQHTTLKALTSLPQPRKLPNDTRVNNTERTIFEIKVEIIKYKSEADEDYHIVVKDEKGNTMIVEIPSVDCMKGSPFLEFTKNARDHFESKFPTKKSGRIHTLRKPVMATIQGVGFFDKIHGQTGVAPNGIELHPVTKICFEGESCFIP